MKIHRDYDPYHRQLDAIAPVYPDEPGWFDDPKDWEKPINSLFSVASLTESGLVHVLALATGRGFRMFLGGRLLFGLATSLFPMRPVYSHRQPCGFQTAPLELC